LALLNDGTPEFVLEEERYNRVKKTTKFPKHCVRAAFSQLGIGDVNAITTPWDIRLLRRTFLSILAGRFPLSLSFLLPSSHVAQQNQIVLLNRAGSWSTACPRPAPNRCGGIGTPCRCSFLALRGGAGPGDGRLWR
jgi:hypothetical protein